MKPVLPAQRRKKIFIFGYGYTASFLSEVLRAFDWEVAGTTTDPEKLAALRDEGIDAYLFETGLPLADPQTAFDGVTHMVFSIPPDEKGDAVFRLHAEDIAACPTIEWAGYLSTTGVYGNHDGNWIDETTPTAPDSKRGEQRLKAEEQWLSLHFDGGVPLHIFRLSGIYGPGRSAIETVLGGEAKRIDKPGHVFNRIHVEDIVQTLIASMNAPAAGEIYNLADDMPAESQEVIAHACRMTGVPVPPLTPFAEAELAPMVRSFYKDSKRVKNDKIKKLGVTLAFPDYKSGLQSCMDALSESEEILNEAAKTDAA